MIPDFVPPLDGPIPVAFHAEHTDLFATRGSNGITRAPSNQSQLIMPFGIHNLLSLILQMTI